jgi:hypothetical protein
LALPRLFPGFLEDPSFPGSGGYPLSKKDPENTRFRDQGSGISYLEITYF